MSNEREMLSPQGRDQQQLILEYAARACGINAAHYDMSKGLCVEHVGMGIRTYWNPKDSNSDCAAMCAKLEIDTIWFETKVECETVKSAAFTTIYSQFSDREAAWRYAATMVAAKIGEMK